MFLGVFFGGGGGSLYACQCVTHCGMWALTRFTVSVLLAVASEEKDPLALALFYRAGVQLGRHVKALIPKVDKVSV